MTSGIEMVLKNDSTKGMHAQRCVPQQQQHSLLQSNCLSSCCSHMATAVQIHRGWKPKVFFFYRF